MTLHLPIKELLAFLQSSEDCEQLSGEEYVADLYDAQPPLTLNLRVSDSEIELLAAAVLEYDAREDGWYMGERVDDAAQIEAALSGAMRP